MLHLHRILFPTDFSPRADEAMLHAAFMARHYGAVLHVLHIYDVTSSRPASGPDEGEPDFKRRLQKRAEQIRELYGGSDIDVTTDVRTGEAPAPEIVQYAAEENIDMIVVGTHGRRGVRRIFLGSVAEEIVRSAPCPVYAIRQDDRLPEPRIPNRVIVPVDFSEFGLLAMRAAKRFVADDGEIILMHAVEEFVPPGVYGLEYPSYHEMSAEIERHARAEMEQMAASVLGDRVQYRIDIRTGYAPTAVVEYADDIDADLIVMSTHGRSGIERMLLGSVTERVVRTSSRPVLVVRSFPVSDAQS